MESQEGFDEERHNDVDAIMLSVVGGDKSRIKNLEPNTVGQLNYYYWNTYFNDNKK